MRTSEGPDWEDFPKEGHLNRHLNDRQELTSEEGRGGRGQSTSRGPEVARLRRQEPEATARTWSRRPLHWSRVWISISFLSEIGSCYGILSRRRS